jgi:hypothetical protein
MQNATMLAQIIGPIYLIIGLGLLLNKDAFGKMYQEFMKSSGLLYLGALMAMIVGMLVIQSHNVWSTNWTVLITLFGWMAFFKGAALVLTPRQFMSFWKKWEVENWINIAMVVYVGLGLVLTYFGYFA